MTEKKEDWLLITLGLFVLIGIGYTSGISGLFSTREASREKAIFHNLRQIAAAGQQYLLEHPDLKHVSYNSLEGEYFSSIYALEGERYDTLTIQRDGGMLQVTTKNGDIETYSY